MPVVDATGAALTHPLSAAIVDDRWTTWPIGGQGDRQWMTSSLPA